MNSSSAKTAVAAAVKTPPAAPPTPAAPAAPPTPAAPAASPTPAAPAASPTPAAPAAPASGAPKKYTIDEAFGLIDTIKKRNNKDFTEEFLKKVSDINIRQNYNKILDLKSWVTVTSKLKEIKDDMPKMNIKNKKAAILALMGYTVKNNIIEPST